MPGDKSISHRALIFGALATGHTHISGLLEAEDVLNTARVLTAMGAPVRRRDGDWEVLGRGCGGLHTPSGVLDFGNSGTGVRLMMGVIAGHDVDVRLVGDASLSRRPMGRVLKPLCEMGLLVLEGENETLPLRLKGTEDLVPIRYQLPVASAQVKSAVLLAGLHARGMTSVVEPKATRDHTERMLRAFGGEVTIEADPQGGRIITVTGQPELSGCHVAVPGDPSSAAFLVAATLVVPGSAVTIENVLVNPTRTGFYETLMEMGADLTFRNERQSTGEPVADIVVAASSLRGVEVPAERVPSMIDEYPVLAVLSAFAEGETIMHGLGELRVKESDRLAATAAGLSGNGVEARIEGDSLIVAGRPDGAVRGGGLVTTHMDHRIAMAFLTMGLATECPVSVDDAGVIATSFPQFQSLMGDLGASFQQQQRGSGEERDDNRG